MALDSTNRIKSIIEAVRQKTGHIHLDLKSAVQYLCACYNGVVSRDVIIEHPTNGKLGVMNTLKSALNASNTTAGTNHTTITSAVRTLFGGYTAQSPLYSFACVSDIHIQYALGIEKFKKALAYFKAQNIPFTCVCGDLTWAGKMINADQYTTEWKGGLVDYKEAKGDNLVYAIGGNHECYTATYDASTRTWSSVDTGFDIDDFRENTGCDPFYTISNKPDNAITHNVYCPTLPDTDVFIMLSIKKATAPNLFFTSADGEDEFAWLQDTLEANKGKRCYVFFHEHDNADKTADPYVAYPYGVVEGSAQGKAFINLMRAYDNVIWFHGHTHNSFIADEYAVSTAVPRGYRSINTSSLQSPRSFNSDGTYVVRDSECLIVDVYEDYLVLNAIDMTSVNQDGTGVHTVIEKYVLDTARKVVIPEDKMTSITATFAQGSTVIYSDKALEDLKSMLTVTAHYESGKAEEVTEYTLSGTLSVGTSTITVKYQGLSTTFNVVVTEIPYDNLVPTSIGTDKKVYNTTGYKQGYRLGSSGAETQYDGAIISGFIPIESLSDVIRITGHPSSKSMVSGYVRAILYNSSFAKVGHYDLQSVRAGVELSTNSKFNTHEIKLVMANYTGMNGTTDGAVYFRVTLGVCDDPKTFVVTRNEEIV